MYPKLESLVHFIHDLTRTKDIEVESFAIQKNHIYRALTFIKSVGILSREEIRNYYISILIHHKVQCLL